MSPSYPAHDPPTTPLYLAYPPSRSIIQLCIMEHHHLTAVISTTTIDKAWRELRDLDGTMLPQNIEKSARHRHESLRKLELQCNCANGWKPVGASLDCLPTYDVLARLGINVFGMSHCGRKYLQPLRPGRANRDAPRIVCGKRNRENASELAMPSWQLPTCGSMLPATGGAAWWATRTQGSA